MSKLIQKYYQELARDELQLITLAKQEALYGKATPEVLAARENFAAFCEYISPNFIPARHHKEWHKEIITNQDSICLRRIAGSNLSILAPRASAKSTVLGLFLAWAIGIHAMEGMALQILYVSASTPIAQAKSATIKNLLLSDRYQEIFPCISKGDKWGDTYWGINRRAAGIITSGNEEFTMIAAGITGSIVSKRCHIIALDDLIKSYDDISNFNIREKMTRNYNGALRPTLLPGGRIMSVGTRFRPDDIHCTDIIPEKGFKLIEQSALLVDEQSGKLKSYWPEFIPLPYLLEARDNDPFSFSFQYQNKIMPIDGITISPNWITYGEPPDSFDAYAIGVDLASSEKDKACFTVATLIGKKDDIFWILDYRRGKWVGNLEKADQIIELFQDWDDLKSSFKVYVESVSYQASFQGDWRAYAYNEKKLYRLQSYPWKMQGDKLSHLLSVSGLFANGRIRWNHYLDFSYPITEFTQFGSVPYTDALDSIVIAIQGLGIRGRIATPNLDELAQNIALS